MWASDPHNRHGGLLDLRTFFAPDSPFRSIPGLAFWEWDVPSGQISYSPEWSILLGLEEEPGPGADVEWWWRGVPEEDKAAFRNACAECVSGRERAFAISIRVCRTDNAMIWLLLKGAAVADESGSVRRIVGYLTDITDLRVDRRFLPHSDDNAETYRAMLENSPDRIFRFDRNFFSLYSNPAAFRYLNVPVEELGQVGSCKNLGISEEYKQFICDHITTVFETGRVIKETTRFYSPLLGEKTGEYYFWPEFASDGTVKAAICQVRDRTEEERVEQEMRLNEERLAALYRLTQMQGAPEEALISFVVEQIALLTKSKHSYMFFPGANGNGGRMHWSRSMHALVGSESLPLDRMPHEHCDGKYGFCGKVTASYIVNMDENEKGHTIFEALCVRRYIILPIFEDGRVVCIASVCNKDKDYDEADLRQMELFINGVWLVLRRNRAMHDLRNAKEAAEKASRVKSEFLANVSHELRTPLNGMLSMLQLLRLAPLSSEQREYVQTASLSGKALLRILSDILDYSRMESGKMELHVSPFDLRATLLSTMTLFIAEARRKGLDTAVHIDDALPRSLLGDDARVRQILFNLVGNALKFTEKGGIALECSLLNHSTRDKVWISLVVRDTGIGIPEHAHSVIFDAFTQLDSSNTRQYPGTGLGLGIVKRLVQLMDGAVSVDSEVGEGTAIHCVLPFEPAAAPMARRAKAAGRPNAPLDILVAEDDPVSRFAIRAFLRHTRHRIVCVSNGRQALEALLLFPFDCLLTDIQMPLMDGLEVVRRIRQGAFASITPTQEVIDAVTETIPEARGARRIVVARDLPVVALTAHAMTGDREHFLNMGMDMYLSKPILFEELRVVLARVAEQIPEEYSAKKPRRV